MINVQVLGEFLLKKAFRFLSKAEQCSASAIRVLWLISITGFNSN